MEQVRILANGTRVDAKTGKFLSPPDTGQITPANARMLAHRRWDNARALAAAGANAACVAAGHVLPDTPMAFIAPITQAQAERALGGDRDSTPAARFVFAAAGIRMADDHQTQADDDVTGDAAATLLAVVRHLLAERDVVDAVAYDPSGA